MTAPRIVLNLDHLSLSGYGHLDEAALRAAIGRELGVLIAQHGAPWSAPSDRSAPAVAALSSEAPHGPVDLAAARIARAVYVQMARTRRSGNK